MKKPYYQCTICGKKFKQEWEAVAHDKKHEGINLFGENLELIE